MLVVQTFEYAEPLCKATVVALVAILQKLRDFYQCNRLLLEEFLVVLIFETDCVQVVAGFQETVEHLKADKVQAPECVPLPMNEICDCMLCCVKYQPVVEGFVLDVLNFEHDAVQVLVFRYDI